MLRAPLSLEKMSYDPESCAVVYRSRMHKTLKRNFQIMHGADWMAQLCSHIPDRFEHLVRYAGWYSNRSEESAGARASRVRSSWARPIYKVYEIDPLAARAFLSVSVGAGLAA